MQCDRGKLSVTNKEAGSGWGLGCLVIVNSWELTLFHTWLMWFLSAEPHESTTACLPSTTGAIRNPSGFLSLKEFVQFGRTFFFFSSYSRFLFVYTRPTCVLWEEGFKGKKENYYILRSMHCWMALLCGCFSSTLLVDYGSSPCLQWSNVDPFFCVSNPHLMIE